MYKKNKSRSQQIFLIVFAPLGFLLALSFYLVYLKQAKNFKFETAAIKGGAVQNLVSESVVKDNQQASSPASIGFKPNTTAYDNTPALFIDSPLKNSPVGQSSLLEGRFTGDYKTIAYRLQSYQVGLVGQGELNIVGGKFSGNIVQVGYKGAGFIEFFIYDIQGREQYNARVDVTFI